MKNIVFQTGGAWLFVLLLAGLPLRLFVDDTAMALPVQPGSGMGGLNRVPWFKAYGRSFTIYPLVVAKGDGSRRGGGNISVLTPLFEGDIPPAGRGFSICNLQDRIANIPADDCLGNLGLTPGDGGDD